MKPASLAAILMVLAAGTEIALSGGATDQQASGVQAGATDPGAATSAQPTIDVSASLPPNVVDPVTGDPIWWSFGGPLPNDALEPSALVDGASACRNGEECPPNVLDR